MERKIISSRVVLQLDRNKLNEEIDELTVGIGDKAEVKYTYGNDKPEDLTLTIGLEGNGDDVIAYDSSLGLLIYGHKKGDINSSKDNEGNDLIKVEILAIYKKQKETGPVKTLGQQ
jgi:hypothetical protein